PTIVLNEESQELEEVVIKAEKPLYEMEMGKMVINVPSSITSAGQSVIDVLEKSPGVFVNRQNNSFALNGKDGVIVLMNGKRSRMPISAVYQMLEGLNASDIEKIEIMTVPPAKYDAEGDAGFINIIMKRNNDVGTNGSVMANLGYGSGLRSGTSLNLSHQSKKLSLYGNYSFNYNVSEQLLNMYRMGSNDMESMTSSSEAVRNTNRMAYNFQLGMDYSLTDKTIIGALISGYNNRFHMNSNSIANFNYSVSTDSLVNIKTEETNHWKHLMGNLNIQHTFKKGQVLTANLDYLTYNNSDPSQYYNQFFVDQGTFIRDENSRISKDTPIDIWVAKLDYSIDLNDNIVLETGLKGALTSLVNDVVYEEKKGDNWVIDDYFSNYADLSEDVLAAFTSFNIKLNEKTTINAGLRYEYTNTQLNTPDKSGVVDRKYGDLFPTFFVSRKINENNVLQFSYGRRITRPNFNEMAPFVIFTDPYTYFSGSEGILPTYTPNIKGDYSFKNFIFSLQYSHDNNVIFRFQPEFDPETNVMVIRTDNVDRRETVSTTITLPFEVTRWWEMQNNLSGNWQRIATQLESGSYTRDQNGFQVNTSN
ncbi:MAG: TonB-dependent receptor domain-containing protein, partial [Anaerolineales bacterium]